MPSDDQILPLRPIIFFSAVYFFISISFFTAYNIQELVADSINEDYKEAWNGFKWNGYVSLGILNWINAIFSWFAPPVISLINAKRGIGLATLGFNLALVTFLFPFKYGLYIATVLSGLSTAILWSSQGTYLSFISNDASITRDTGISWSTMQGGAVLGNIVVAYLFKGQEHISANTRTLLYSSFIMAGLVGIILSCFLKTPKKEEKSESVVKVFVQSIKLLTTKRMALLLITCFYTGLEISFFTTLYGTSVGYTKTFGVNRKQDAGETGMLIGAGQIAAGLLLILTRRMKKPEYILVFAYVISILTFGCVYVNIPDNASRFDTDEPAIIHSSLILALICAFSLGFCDGCYETQIYRSIVKHYPDNTTAPYAIYISIQAIAMGGMYLFSDYFGLHFHCIMLVITCTIGTATFFFSCGVEDPKDKESNLEKVNFVDEIDCDIES